MQFEELVQQDVERFQELVGLRPGADVQVVLLKGHLLIEELLQSFVEKAVPNPEPLAEARLTFLQRLALAHALHREPTRFGYGWVWAAVRSLNRLRNQMVHNVNPRDFEREVAKFATTVEEQLPFPIVPGEGAEYQMAKCGFMLSVLNLCLSRLLQSAS